MKVLVTGGTGALGKFLLPLLLENKHEVVALTRSVTKAAELEDSGVSSIVVAAARPGQSDLRPPVNPAK